METCRLIFLDERQQNTLVGSADKRLNHVGLLHAAVKQTLPTQMKKKKIHLRGKT